MIQVMYRLKNQMSQIRDNIFSVFPVPLRLGESFFLPSSSSAISAPLRELLFDFFFLCVPRAPAPL